MTFVRKLDKHVRVEITETASRYEFDLYDAARGLFASGAHLKAAGWTEQAIIQECRTILEAARQRAIPGPSGK